MLFGRHAPSPAARETIHRLTAGGATISVSTLRRAEDGFASRRNLKWIARAIGFPEDRYLETDAADFNSNPTFNLSGKWRVYYLEDDVGSDAYVAVENLFVTQTDTRVTGIYEPVRTDHPRGYRGTDAFQMEGYVAEHVVMGRYYRERARHPRGAGVFQLLLLRNGAWAEGMCTFFGDDRDIMASYNLWIKEDSEEFSLMVQQAEQLMKMNKLLIHLPLSTRPRPPIS